MAHSSIKLIPGVNADYTPSLNQAGISASNMIRFREGLTEKLGGWQKYTSVQSTSKIRDLHAWLDLNGGPYLSVGAEQSLSIIRGADNSDITPQTRTTDRAPAIDTTSGSKIVTIYDIDSKAGAYDTVLFATPVAVGGIVLAGAYPVTTPAGANTYTITAESNATSTVTNGGAVPIFTTTINQFTVLVTLPSHGYSIDDSVPFPTPTVVGGITISGLYTVSQIVSVDSFVINLPLQATSTDTVSMNGGNAKIVYYIAVGPPPPGAGYGVLGYGVGAYGTGTPPPAHTGTPITASDWSTDNWGQVLLSCPSGGAIYQWAPDAGFRTATIVPSAPTANGGIFIAMPQRILVAWSSSTLGVLDPLLIRWSEVSDYSIWAASAVNQAGSYRIPRGSKIMGGLQGAQQGLIWTDLGLWAMQYQGPPFVFGFNEIATGCGLMGQHAAANIGAATYWMSQKQFFVLESGVRPVPCPVWDVVFQNLDTANLHKICAAANSQFNEVAWYYPSLGGGGEVDSYVKYNTVQKTWDYGTIGRTAWVDQSVLGSPIGASPQGYIYQHETSFDADGAPMEPMIESGYFALSEGEHLSFVDWVLPDFKFGYYEGSQNAAIQITFLVVDYPGQTPREYGPYTVTQSTQSFTPRFRGRQVAIRLSSSDVGSFWRIGNIRFRIAPDGRR